jgi:predicted transposase YdaD
MAAKEFDPTLKTLVEGSPGDWPVLIGQPAARTHAIDADIATVSGAADKVLHVSANPPYLIHLDFQSGHDSSELPELLHTRSALLYHRHRLLVRSVAVLLRREADSATALTEKLELGFDGEEPYDTFRYQVLRVWELPPAQLLQGGLSSLPLAPISAVTKTQLSGIIQQMEQRMQNQPQKDVEEVWSATFILLGLRYSPEFARQLLRRVRAMKESTTYQSILEEGKAMGARELVLHQGRVRFGPPDATVTAALEGITDLGRLEELSERLLTPKVASWEELLAPPTPRPRSRRRPKA